MHGVLLSDRMATDEPRPCTSTASPFVTMTDARREDVTDERTATAGRAVRAHRAHLRAVAYRMLGSVSEAEDAVQEAWLRLSRSDTEAIANLGGWLTTVVAPRLPGHAARAPRAAEDYVGSWLPEPVVSSRTARTTRRRGAARGLGRARAAGRARDARRRASGSRSCCTTCSPCRSSEIAPIVERTPAAARQLASRARRRVRGAAPDAGRRARRSSASSWTRSSPPRARETSRACSPSWIPTWCSASTPAGAGRTHGPRSTARGGRAPGAGARQAVRAASRGRPSSTGAPAQSSRPATHAMAVAGFTIVGGRIVAIDVIVDRTKLQRLSLEL